MYLESVFLIADVGFEDANTKIKPIFFSLKPFSLQFREILFLDEAAGQKAFFTYKLSSSLVAGAAKYGKQLPLINLAWKWRSRHEV